MFENRIQPLGSPDAYKTYSVSSPISTHTRSATCQEVDCQAYANGWRSIIDTSTELGQLRAKYITEKSGRHFSTQRLGDMVTFTFSPEQNCFAQHRVSLERPEFYQVRKGDWRLDGGIIHDFTGRPEDWRDDFAEHQQAIADRIERG